MGTPHNEAEKGEIAKRVLMPGGSASCKIYCGTFFERCSMF